MTGIGSTSGSGGDSLISSAIRAALDQQRSQISSARDAFSELAKRASEEGRFVGDANQPQLDAANALTEGLREVDSAVRSLDELPLEVVSGEVDLHEAMARIQESKITFQYTLEVRNKLIDAYREVMRMSV